MIKILIVDDDALTRKGIRMLMPWQKYDMEIIGEAGNGEEAICFLQYNHADLALVDIDMPVMDGVTFIREATLKYPSLIYVVLTIHTEFEYVQKVLRLGAIDYIAKNQFDKENFDLILERINASISKRMLSVRQSSDIRWRKSKILYHSIYALITLDPDNDDHILLFLEQNELLNNTDVHEMMTGIWVFLSEKSEFSFPDSFTNTTLMQISDVNDMTYNELGSLLRHYLKEQFFYDYQPLNKINYKRAHELREETLIADTQTLNTLKESWISLNWVHQNDIFNRMRFDLKESKLKPSSLYHFLLSLESVWNTAYSELTGFTLSLPPVFTSWLEVENWLSEAYEKTNQFINNSKYSEDITKQILQVRGYIDANAHLPINTTEISRNANMSYGYFSRCFHDLVGMTFSDYYTSVRMNNAKHMLKTSSKSIQQIAVAVGYNDEKYFSRLFKRHIGCSPSEYRKTS